MNVTLRQLKAFVLLARLKSFTKAGQAMHVTQSSLSVLVKELEGAMKTRLVDRTTRNVMLTGAGAEFFIHAERILDELGRAIDNVDQLVAKERGHVSIAAPLVLAGTFLPPLLKRFRGLYPGIDLRVNDSLPAQVLAQVHGGAADIGIGTFAAAERNLHRHLLFKEALVAAFPVSHPFARKRSVRWADLASERVMALRRGSVFRDLADAGFVAAGLSLNPAFEADYVGTLLGMVDAGLGVAVIPGYSTALTDRSRVLWARLNKPVIEREVVMVHRAGMALSPAAQAFVDFVRGQRFLGESSGVKSRRRTDPAGI